METTTVLTDIINTFEGCSTSHHVHAGLESAEITERLNKLGISFEKRQYKSESKFTYDIFKIIIGDTEITIFSENYYNS